MKNPPLSPVPALCVSLITSGIIRHRVDTNFISHFIEHIHVGEGWKAIDINVLWAIRAVRGCEGPISGSSCHGGRTCTFEKLCYLR